MNHRSAVDSAYNEWKKTKMQDDMPTNSAQLGQSALTRRRFLEAAVATGIVTRIGADESTTAAETDRPSSESKSLGKVVLNDDGNVFLTMSDDLGVADLRRYLKTYCQPGVSTVAYCVGDISWPTRYASRVGEEYGERIAGDDLKLLRVRRNLANFADEKGGYFGAALRILSELGKTTLASFRMNDAHYTSPDNPKASKFWRQHAQLTLGATYGYYGGCLNYESELVRNHFFERVVEFAQLYPDIDGIELDAMRSPYFFPPGKGKEGAPLLTELVRRIKAALAEQAKRLQRPDYLLTMNAPLTPALALESGLDVAAWDEERLVDSLSVGPDQAYMNHAMEQWKELLTNGTPVFAYVGCSPHTGQYLGPAEYRAAAANAYGAGADGVYLFNYPCLFELALQQPTPPEEVKTELPDLRSWRQGDFSKVGEVLNEIGNADSLRGKNKRFLFYFNEPTGYRHHVRERAVLSRTADGANLTAHFRCYDDFAAASAITLRFKVENVMRGERFEPSLNGHSIKASQHQVRYAANGRDTRVHTVNLGPYVEYEIAVEPSQLEKGENQLDVRPVRLVPELETQINLREIELLVEYAQ